MIPVFDPVKYLRQPFEVSIETLTLCNAACTFCPYPTLERKGARMDHNTLAAISIQLQDFTLPFFLSPFKVNEPLLDAGLLPWLARVNARIPLARLRLFTNGSPLTPTKIIEIANLSNVEHLWISLNSVLPSEYKALMSIEFDITARKLDILHSLVSGKSFKHPVVLSRVIDPRNADRYFHKYCSIRWPAFKTFDIKRDGWLGFVDPWNPAIPKTPCGRWWELSILSTGLVSLCCMDGKGEFPIGDASTESLLEIYNRGTWLERRELMASRAKYHPCSTCTY